MTLKAIWNSWTSPTVSGELAQRREAILFELLACLFVIGCLAVAIQLEGIVSETGDADLTIWMPVTLATPIGFGGLLHAARSGHHRAAATTLVGILVAESGGLVFSDGLTSPIWTLLGGIAVLLAAILLGGRAAVVATAVLAALAAAALTSHHGGPNLPARSVNAGDAVAIVLLFALIARACWIYTREALSSVDDVLTASSPDSPLQQLRTKELTLREIEVVQLVAEGLSNEGVGRQLFLSPRTIQTHVANAMRKTDCSNRTELGVLAIREGLVPIRAEATSGPTISTRT